MLKSGKNERYSFIRVEYSFYHYFVDDIMNDIKYDLIRQKSSSKTARRDALPARKGSGLLIDHTEFISA